MGLSPALQRIIRRSCVPGGSQWKRGSSKARRVLSLAPTSPSSIAPCTQLRLIIRWSAGDNPIEVFRVALSLHQGLPPPSGATRPVRKPWCAIVERRNDGFRFHRHLVDGTIGEIDDFFRMSDRERRISACVSRVRKSVV